MKNNRGEISIMSIIIAIILIILIGITIFMLTGENGLFLPKGYEKNTNTANNSITTKEEQNVINNNTNGETAVPIE